MEGTIFLAQYLSGREHALTGTLCCTIKGRGAAYRHKRVPVQLSSLAANINMAENLSVLRPYSQSNYQPKKRTCQRQVRVYYYALTP